MKTLQELENPSTKPFHDVTKFYPPPSRNRFSTEWHVEVFSVAHEPERWHTQRKAAGRCYANRKLEVVERDHSLAGERCPTYSPEVSLNGVPMGGGCMHLPDASGRLPVQDELEGFVDSRLLEELIRRQATEGIVHCAGLWVDPNHGR